MIIVLKRTTMLKFLLSDTCLFQLRQVVHTQIHAYISEPYTRHRRLFFLANSFRHLSLPPPSSTKWLPLALSGLFLYNQLVELLVFLIYSQSLTTYQITFRFAPLLLTVTLKSICLNLSQAWTTARSLSSCQSFLMGRSHRSRARMVSSCSKPLPLRVTVSHSMLNCWWTDTFLSVSR